MVPISELVQTGKSRVRTGHKCAEGESVTACSGLCLSLCLILQETFVLWIKLLVYTGFIKMTKKGIDTCGNSEI